MPDTKTITGNGKTRVVKIDGIELTPYASQKVYNHSPDGFNWAYGGSGPAQLALALLLHFGVDGKVAVNYHQELKRDIISVLPEGDFSIEAKVVTDWIAKNLPEKEKVFGLYTRYGYQVFGSDNDGSPLYSAGNSPYESSAVTSILDGWCKSFDDIRKACERSALEIAEESGAEYAGVSYNKDAENEEVSGNEGNLAEKAFQQIAEENAIIQKNLIS